MSLTDQQKTFLENVIGNFFGTLEEEPDALTHMAAVSMIVSAFIQAHPAYAKGIAANLMTVIQRSLGETPEEKPDNTPRIIY